MAEVGGMPEAETSPEAGAPDKAAAFDWNWADSQFVAEIPDSQRIPLPPSTVLQGRHRPWEETQCAISVPDLRGRDLAAVKCEAGRIQVGSQFDTFAEFDRCLHSWCVLHGRVAARSKTKRDFCVRVCRFAHPIFSPHSKTEGLKDTSIGSGSNMDEEQFYPQQNCEGGEECDCIHCMCGEESPEVLEDYSMQIAESSKKTSRLPLEDLSVNTMATASQGGVLQKNPRTIIQHTSTWLPSKRAADSQSGMKTSRRASDTGACGELSRFLPTPMYDDLTNDTTFGPCPFRVRCQRQHSTGRIHITICELKHTCPQYKHKWRGPTHNARWLGETLANRIMRNVKVPASELLEGFQTDYHRNSTYQQCWRGKDLVRDWYLGGQRESFHHIPSLLQTLQEVDLDCVVDWTVHDDGKTFMRAFICPSGTRGALQFCQPVVCLDATHTKNRKYPTQVFLATVLDGNSQVLILCFAVAPSENTDNWAWFLRLLDGAIHGIDSASIPFISDRQKGLIATVREVFPGKIHGHCANHIRANVKTLFGKAAEHFFVGCVYSNSKKLFDDILRQLRESLSKGVAATEYIEKIESRLYARYAFPLPRHGKVTSNPCEQANAGLLPLREYAPFKLLVELWFYIQVRFRDRRATALTTSEQYSEPALRRFKVNLETFGQWQVLSDGHTEAKVQTHDHLEQYLVRRSPHLTCSCVEAQEMGWPCQHVMAWDNQEGKDFTKHFHKCWRMQSLRALYTPNIPCFLSNDLELSMACCPPEPAIKRGRHRVVRMQPGRRGRTNRELGDDEFIDASGNLLMRYPLQDDPNSADTMPCRRSTAGVTRHVPLGRPKRVKGANAGKTKCGRCGGLGHNRRSCTNDTNGILSSASFEQSIQEDVPPVHLVESIESIFSDGISEECSEGQNGEILGGHFGYTQSPQEPEWMAHGLTNWIGIDELQYYIDLASSVAREHADTGM